MKRNGNLLRITELVYKDVNKFISNLCACDFLFIFNLLYYHIYMSMSLFPFHLLPLFILFRIEIMNGDNIDLKKKVDTLENTNK